MRDVGWVLQTGPCLNVLSAWGVGKTQEIKNFLEREGWSVWGIHLGHQLLSPSPMCVVRFVL